MANTVGDSHVPLILCAAPGRRATLKDDVLLIKFVKYIDWPGGQKYMGNSAALCTPLGLPARPYCRRMGSHIKIVTKALKSVLL